MNLSLEVLAAAEWTRPNGHLPNGLCDSGQSGSGMWNTGHSVVRWLGFLAQTARGQTRFHVARMFRSLACLSAIAVALAAFLPLSGHAADAPLKITRFNVGFTEAHFAGVNRNDAIAAFKIFCGTVGRKRGYDLKSAVEVYSNQDGFVAAITNGQVELAVVDTWEYVSMEVGDCLTPAFIPAKQGRAAAEYLLLTKCASGRTNWPSLRGGEIALLHNSTASMARPWLETLLLERDLGTPETFFSQVTTVSKPSQAVLPVFFGKLGACVVDRPSWELMRELNPQLGRQLEALEVSPPFADFVLCVRNRDWDPQYRRDTVESLAELHLEPAGQQILTLFKITRMEPFRDAHLATVRELKAKHDQAHRNDRPRSESADLNSRSQATDQRP